MDPLQQRRRLVCVVEDDEAVRRALAFALDLEGFAVETYGTGEALLERGESARPGCLVLDERLPGISGLETLRQMRERYPNVPTILITSHPKPALRAAAAAVGAPILEKPLLGESLTGMIHELINAADACD